jgi:hypothetical protein
MVKYLDCSGHYQLPRNLTNVSFPKYATDQELLDFYNQYSESTALAKFASRGVAERKCLELKQAMDWLSQSAQSTKKVNKVNMAKKTKASNAKAAKAKKAATKSNGSERKSALSDYTLHKLVKENPRREGTFGYKSWEAFRSGDTVQQALDKGARTKDLRHDEAMERLEIREPKGGAKVAATKENTAKAPKAKKAKAKAKKKNGNGNGSKKIEATVTVA